MKDKKVKFTEHQENITETALNNLDILDEVAKMPQYDDLLATVPEEDHPKLQEALEAMSEPWQDVYDHIVKVLENPESRLEFRKQCLERDWGRKQAKKTKE